MIEVVACATTDAALRAYKGAHARTDIVELRLDGMRDLDLDRLLAARGKPKLLSMRSRAQGGGAAPSDRAAVLAKIARSSAEYLDIEPQDTDLPALRRAEGPKRVLSWHDFRSTPLDLRDRLLWLLGQRRADLVKIVTFAEVAGDILRVRDLLRGAGEERLIAFCMGPKGVPSRILAPSWGSAAVFAPRRGAPPSAPGQVPLEDLLEIYRIDDLRPETGLLGVLGSPVSHSLSPVLHNAALEASQIDLRYLPFEATTLAEFLPVMAELRVKGLSVTLPFKEAFLPHLDVIDPVARRCGAVNTVIKVWNRLAGHNTDIEASVEPLRRLLPLRGASVGVMGAGGAARALVEGLRPEGARVTLFNRTPSRARALARATGARHLPWRRLRGFRCDLLVNATPVGMAPLVAKAPVPASWIRASRVYDLVYNPKETLFLARARRRGLEALGGAEMFLAQGLAQFRLFTGQEPPREVMRAALDRSLPRGAVSAPDKAARHPPRRRSGGVRHEHR
jgi:3-dehydroquinate dehydratase / shikimate dehydrogenase